MEWERFDIMAKRVKIADFNDYNFIQDFLSSAKSLMPTWVVSKRMEIFKTPCKAELKFLDVLLEFRQFWAMNEFKTKIGASAFAASLHGFGQPSGQEVLSNNSCQNSNQNNKNTKYEPGQPRPCNCGEVHRGDECFYLAEGTVPHGFEGDEKIVKKFHKACHRIPFRTFVRKSEWTARWLKDYIDANWPVNGQHKQDLPISQDLSRGRSRGD